VNVVPAPGTLGRLDLAAVELHQLLDQRQSDPRTLVGARPHALDAVEALEEARHLLGRHAGAGVLHLQRDTAAGRLQRDLDATVEGELERVRDQVEDDGLPHAVVDEHRLAERRADHGEGEPGALERRAEGAGGVAGELGEVGLLVPGLDAPGLDPRELEERVDQALQAKLAAADELELVDLRLGERTVGALEEIVGRPQHQRERGAELVAHVAEERGLGAVDLGQGLGAPLRLLERPAAGQRRRHVAADQLEEGPVSLVEPQARAQAGDHQRRRLDLAGEGDGQDQRRSRLRDVGVRPQRHALDHAGAVLPRHVFQRPRRAGGPRVDPGDSGEPRVRPIEEVEQDEGQLVRILGDRLHGPLAGVLRRTRAGGRRRQRPQGPDAPFAQHLARGLADRAEDAGDALRLVPDRAVREGEVALLGEAVALEEQELVLRPGGGAAGEHTLEHRADDVPDLRPHIAPARAHRARVLVAEHRAVGVVVDLDHLGPPPDEDGEARGQTDADGRPERLRPARDRAERGARPVHRAHERAHLAAPSENPFNFGKIACEHRRRHQARV
jgi:hypothetical protein